MPFALTRGRMIWRRVSWALLAAREASGSVSSRPELRWARCCAVQGYMNAARRMRRGAHFHRIAVVLAGLDGGAWFRL